MLLIAATPATAATRYVDALNPAPAAPYTSWITAATNIQDAVDVSAGGDEIIVTNGIYSNGGRAVFGLMTNRVAVDRPLNLHSVNGPQVTTIVGYQVPELTNGDGAIRCVYLTNGASLVGFTLINGGTRSAGDLLRERAGGGVFCESGSAIVSNCVVTTCSASAFGEAHGGSLYDCTLVNNRVAASSAFLSNCVVVQNWEASVYQCTLYHCLINTNGYGPNDCTVNACVIIGNHGSGADFSRVSNSLLVNNFGQNRGNAFGSTLTNCTVAADPGNYTASAPNSSTLNNCILYYSYPFSSTLNYCCQWPYTFVSGSNFSLDPELVDPTNGNFHLSSSSPCINAGTNIYIAGTVDLDLNPRVFGPAVDIGAYEFQGSPTPTAPYFLTQPQPATLTVYAGANVSYSPSVYGTAPKSYQWFFAGNPLSTATNSSLNLTNVQVNQSGIYYLNVSNVAGQATSSNVSLTVNPAPVAGTHYVNPNNLNPAFPFTNWPTAATNIQKAIDAAVAGDQIMVTNGIYASGEQQGSRVYVDRAVTLRSVNGPQRTIIDGGGQVQGVVLPNGASLIGFTVTNCYAGSGAGVSAGSFLSSAVVQNCILVGNIANPQGGGFGGGAAGGTLNNCLIVGNSAYQGGGVYFCDMNNCTVVSNTATSVGGGIWSTNGQLNNCIIYYNNAPDGSNWAGSGFRAGPAAHVFCCTIPAQSELDITNAPQFIDPASGNYRLLPSSPCINGGTNFYVVGSTDLDGRPRIVGPAVDIGAYELQTNLFLEAVLQGAGIQVIVHGQPGTTCTLFVSSNLSVWAPLTQVSCSIWDGIAVVNESPGSSFSRRFYRAVSP